MQLELLQRLPELCRVVLLGSLAALDLLGDEALQSGDGGVSWGNPSASVTSNAAHLDFSLDEAGDILLVLKDGQRLEQVVEQPVPVLVHLFHSSSWHTRTHR